MTHKRKFRRDRKGFTRYHFLMVFWGVVAVLYGVKMIFPEWTSRQIECLMVLQNLIFVQADDSVSKHSREVDSLFLCTATQPHLVDQGRKTREESRHFRTHF